MCNPPQVLSLSGFLYVHHVKGGTNKAFIFDGIPLADVYADPDVLYTAVSFVDAAGSKRKTCRCLQSTQELGE